MKQSLVRKVKDANFIRIICDGATDASHGEAEIVYIRYCMQGVEHTHFVGIRNMIGRPDAEGIETTMAELFHEIFQDDWKGKIVATRSDGENVLFGFNGGVLYKKKLNDLVRRP